MRYMQGLADKGSPEGRPAMKLREYMMDAATRAEMDITEF